MHSESACTQKAREWEKRRPCELELQSPRDSERQREREREREREKQKKKRDRECGEKGERER